MDSKYLSDGRKVVIVGKLNNQETIVQEIFVTNDGVEVPSGENFVVKSLHDEPVVSYKEKEAKVAEERFKTAQNNTKECEQEYRRAKGKLRGIADILRSSKKLAALLPEAELETFTMFLTGTIEYLVVDGYGRVKPPIKMIDEIICWENHYGNYNYDYIKLVSALGKSNGEIEYRIHQYNDDSGSSTRAYPFVNKEDAMAHIKAGAEAKIQKKGLSQESYEECIDMGIIFSGELTKQHKESRIKNIKSSIEAESERQKKSQELLDALSRDLAEVASG